MEYEKPTNGTIFIIVGFLILWIVNIKEINPTEILIDISGILLVFPIMLLTIFAISSLRKSMKKSYAKERGDINNEINDLRKQQENKNTPLQKIIDIDEKIFNTRKDLLVFSENRFEKMIFKSLLLLIATMLILSLDLGQYIDFSSVTLGIISFLWGIYYLIEMIKDIFKCF